jgi:hypothetical protein
VKLSEASLGRSQCVNDVRRRTDLLERVYAPLRPRARIGDVQQDLLDLSGLALRHRPRE